MKIKEEELLKKFLSEFEFKLKLTDKNPTMKDSDNMNHFRVNIRNIQTKRVETFVYSMGLGITDIEDDDICFGLISCFYMDLPYSDLDEFDGLGYEGQEAVKIYNAICKQQEKLKRLDLLDVLENLTDQEKELLN